MEIYQQLEKEFCIWTGGRNTVAVATGTAALHLGLEALGLPQGSAVLVPELSMIACPRAVTMAGLEVIPVDCDENLLISVEALEKMRYSYLDKRKIRAVMPVHTYGRLCDMPVITRWARQNDIYVIEDLAEAHGAHPHPETDVACWSFYKNKIIAGEEGGMIDFKAQAHAEKARCLRSLGFTENHDFYHEPRGVNARLSNSHARLIFDSFHAFNKNFRRRKEICSHYAALIPQEFQPPTQPQYPWVYDLRLPPEIVKPLVDSLFKYGVREGFKPIQNQIEYADFDSVIQGVWRNVMYLPIRPEMTYQTTENLCRLFLEKVDSVRNGLRETPDLPCSGKG